MIAWQYIIFIILIIIVIIGFTIYFNHTLQKSSQISKIQQISQQPTEQYNHNIEDDKDVDYCDMLQNDISLSDLQKQNYVPHQFQDSGNDYINDCNEISKFLCSGESRQEIYVPMQRKQYRRLLHKNSGEVLMNIRPSSNKLPLTIIEEKAVQRTNTEANKIIQQKPRLSYNEQQFLKQVKLQNTHSD